MTGKDVHCDYHFHWLISVNGITPISSKVSYTCTVIGLWAEGVRSTNSRNNDRYNHDLCRKPRFVKMGLTQWLTSSSRQSRELPEASESMTPCESYKIRQCAEDHIMDSCVFSSLRWLARNYNIEVCIFVVPDYSWQCIDMFVIVSISLFSYLYFLLLY